MKERWCNLCKSLDTFEELRRHGFSEFGNIEHAGEILVIRLQCGCRMERCMAGVKSYSQCSIHRYASKAGEEK